LIQSIQHEGEQKQWLYDRLPDAHAQSIFKVGESLEPEIFIVLNELLVMSKQGLQPKDLLVQERANALKLIIEQLFGQPLQEMETSEMGRMLGEMDPQLFPNFEPGFMNYLSEALGHLLSRLWEGRRNE
jgi:hypothetical protein